VFLQERFVHFEVRSRNSLAGFDSWLQNGDVFLQEHLVARSRFSDPEARRRLGCSAVCLCKVFLEERFFVLQG